MKKHISNTAATVNTTHTRKGDNRMTVQKVTHPAEKATRIFITCENPMEKGLHQEQVESILKQLNTTYYIFVYGQYMYPMNGFHSEPLRYLQVYMELASPANPEQIKAAFQAEQYEVPHPDCPSVMNRNWLAKIDYFRAYEFSECPEYSPIESGICPGDVATLEQYQQDLEATLDMVEQGATDQEILGKYPSATTHLHTINAYRLHFLNDPENYYNYIMKEDAKNEQS